MYCAVISSLSSLEKQAGVLASMWLVMQLAGVEPNGPSASVCEVHRKVPQCAYFLDFLVGCIVNCVLVDFVLIWVSNSRTRTLPVLPMLSRTLRSQS